MRAQFVIPVLTSILILGTLVTGFTPNSSAAKGTITFVNPAENHGIIQEDGCEGTRGECQYQFRIPQGLANPNYNPQEGDKITFTPAEGQTVFNVQKITITQINTGLIIPTSTASLDKGTDNLPAIAYVDGSNSRLHVVACNDAICSNPTITQVNTDSIDPNFAIVSLDKGTDNLPAIAYVDGISSKLHVVACNDAICSNPIITPVNTSFVFSFTSISLDKGTDNLPAIAYVDPSSSKLHVVACNDAICSNPTITQVNTGIISEITPVSLDKGTDNLPAIAYVDGLSNKLHVVACNDAICSNPTITQVNTDFIFEFASISLDKGTDNLPAIAYVDPSNFKLHVVACNDAICSNPTITQVNTGFISSASPISLDKGTDNLLAIAYVDGMSNKLHVVTVN